MHQQKTTHTGLQLAALGLLMLSLAGHAQAQSQMQRHEQAQLRQQVQMLKQANADAQAKEQAKDARGQFIVAYFSVPDADGNSSVVAHPAPGGFFRVLLGQARDGLYHVQDHYQDTGARQSSVIALNITDVNNWEPETVQGQLTLYRPNGTVRAQTSFLHGKRHGKETRYNEDGSTLSTVNWANDLLHGAFMLQEPGTQRRLEGLAKANGIEDINAWDANGNLLDRGAAIALLQQVLIHGFR